jgi:hypothetical protein
MLNIKQHLATCIRLLVHGPISWKSRNQLITAMSLIEAQYVLFSSAAKEAI